MRTPSFVSTHPLRLLTVLLLVGSSATSFAANEAAPASPPVALPPPAVEVGTPAPTAPDTVAPSPAAVSPTQALPGSQNEFAVERLPGSAYPEPYTRGLKHGSLWLTFHGLQWPYMPSLGQGSRFAIGVSGWGWVDTAYQKFAPWGESSNVDASRIKYWKQQSRLVVRVTPTYAFDDGFFLQGQAEVVATGDQTISRTELGGADTDDLWLRVGKWNKWDFQVGRYEGWEVFHLGMGLDQNTFERQGAVGKGETSYNIQFYGLTDNQFRPAGSAGNMAFHYYPLPYLRFEILGMAGSLNGPAYGTRPVAILDLGWLKLKVGTEYQKVVGQQAEDKTDVTSRGVGGALQFVFDPHIEFGVNAAQGTVVNFDDKGKQNLKRSLTRTSVGGFLNVSNGHPRHTLIFGLGSILTRNEDQDDTAVLGGGQVDEYWHYQGFMAAQYVLLNQFYIKLVGGYSRGHWSIPAQDQTIILNDEMYSVRLRFSFYF